MIAPYKSTKVMKCKVCGQKIKAQETVIRYEAGWGHGKQTGNICFPCLAKGLSWEDITRIHVLKRRIDKEEHDDSNAID